MSNDEAYLLDIALAAREIRSLVRAIDRQGFEDSRTEQLACTKLLQDMGEAAGKRSPVTRQGLPGVPWPDLIGLRNRLVHDYRGIDLDLVWDTITQDMEPLLAAIEPVLPPETP